MTPSTFSDLYGSNE